MNQGSTTTPQEVGIWHPVSEQPKNEDAMFVVRDEDGQSAFAVRSEGQWEHVADADCGEIAFWTPLPEQPRRCTCYVLPHADDCGLFMGITQAGERVYAEERAEGSPTDKHDERIMGGIESTPGARSGAYPDASAWSGNANGLTALLEENKRLKALAERQMNDAEAARLELAELKASSARSDDKQRLDWLERFVVEVRMPLAHGSRHMFFASPTQVEGDEDQPSKIRARIDYERNGGPKP